MEKIYCFDENDKIKVVKIEVSEKRRQLYECLGIYEGAILTIFFKCKKNLIVKLDEKKIALSKEASEEIFAERIF